jgi:hypothetical protein
MSYSIKGKLFSKSAVLQVNDRFKKLEFVLEVQEQNGDTIYTNYIKFQLAQNKCDLINNFSIGQEVELSFNIKGNKYEKAGVTNVINTLDVWKIS